jgi:hypothetical protein
MREEVGQEEKRGGVKVGSGLMGRLAAGSEGDTAGES